MAENSDSTEKTLEPTEKKLKDARKKGDVPSSKETGNMVVVVAMLGIAALVLPYQAPQIVVALSVLLDHSPNLMVATGEPGVIRLGQIMSEFFYMIVWAVLPIFGVLFLGGAIGAVIQGETVVAAERIKPKLSKLSPLEGLKRLFSANALVEFAKSIVKVLAIGGLAVWFTNEAVRRIWTSSGFIPEHLPGYLTAAAVKLLIAAAILLVPIAIADILWRRFDWRRKQRMSQKDIKDEHKESEGSPEIRQKRARRRRELSQQRTITAVPLADVILTNPTHYSIALKYDPAQDMAPVCIAKGADHLARRIREVAAEHDIPMIENKPLTRMLYDEIDVDQVIPVAHWEIVAEIISFVFDLRNNKKRAAPQGSTLRTDPY
ncbi:MAG: flagellar biosynthesis protein FlhB [Roseobacter sp.]|jgi:flagellar biosynthetic protein FlhB|uniref:Flagellar biosynthetic protein FlhB n=2 Tax=Sulfitobacter TaxID=60136 RepID=A0A1H3B7K1_9RHOB|nr:MULTISPECIES: flagellar type III secretion system protein FlhB [Sulfitobacter]MAJ76485.1 flagellar biosynthesis protein FlhB [Roseobacter sp.]NKX47612.1 flagellar biosynthesis protein FlhB [Rhodobacteraceae bacterium R_SAG8]AXI52653.1 flagellar biosynthesis protein FlhB [Sulfitobacter sp. SK025]EAP79620.1 flagella-associated protein [Sulfitobacter sp. NAS-14.1]EAP82929.1 flagella-associated protein [Sulfitobacter sp. EE-36]|tara:strand:+ start:3528 stop:4655 length:1128 start_codon:yes stop_codon:yes gene_type:complete